jgi:hypothetical protein
MPRAARWCFTINNYTPQDVRAVQLLIYGPEAIVGIAGFEISVTGTPHIQGFVRLNRRLSLNQILARLGVGAHCEVAKGSDIDSVIYCSKGNNVFVLRPPDPDHDPQGSAIVAAAQTLTLEQFVGLYPDVWLQHRTTLEKIMLVAAIAKTGTRDGDLRAKNLWIWGVPGIGKSWLARQQNGTGTTLWKNCDIWWDGYSLALTGGVIVENSRAVPVGDQLVQELEKWGDRYPFVGQVKGSNVVGGSRKVHSDCDVALQD